MKRSLSVIFLLAVTSLAFATPDYLELLQKHYGFKDDSKIGAKSCGACHVSDEDLKMNPYGAAVKTKAKEMGTGVTDAVFAALDKEDSDKDGTPNGEEFKNDTLPGDPTSGAKAGVVVEPEKPKGEPFPPKNGFHPAIVHFPIALFIGGLLLDFLGMLKKDSSLLLAGWYNLIMSAVTAIGGVLSGALAMALLKMPYKGMIFQHLILAVVSSLLIFVLVGLRVHRHEKMNIPVRVLYYVIAAAVLLMISWAGHLGGEVVYGG